MVIVENGFQDRQLKKDIIANAVRQLYNCVEVDKSDDILSIIQEYITVTAAMTPQSILVLYDNEGIVRIYGFMHKPTYGTDSFYAIYVRPTV